MRVVAAIVLIGLASAAAFDVYKGSHQAASIQTEIDGLKVRQADLKSRFDALLLDSARAANDPDTLKALGARHLALVKEQDALKNDLSRVQKELDEMKR